MSDYDRGDLPPSLGGGGNDEDEESGGTSPDPVTVGESEYTSPLPHRDGARVEWHRWPLRPGETVRFTVVDPPDNDGAATINDPNTGGYNAPIAITNPFATSGTTLWESRIRSAEQNVITGEVDVPDQPEIWISSAAIGDHVSVSVEQGPDGNDPTENNRNDPTRDSPIGGGTPATGGDSGGTSPGSGDEQESGTTEPEATIDSVSFERGGPDTITVIVEGTNLSDDPIYWQVNGAGKGLDRGGDNRATFQRSRNEFIRAESVSLAVRDDRLTGDTVAYWEADEDPDEIAQRVIPRSTIGVPDAGSSPDGSTPSEGSEDGGSDGSDGSNGPNLPEMDGDSLPVSRETAMVGGALALAAGYGVMRS